MMHRVLIGASLALLLSGCDPYYGVERQSILAAPPELECVRRAVEQTSGVSMVVMTPRSRGKGLFHEAPSIYDYSYIGPDGIRGSLYLVKTYDGRASYHTTYLQIGHKPPQTNVDNIRPVMRAIENKLAARCGITELTAGVREDCPGVTCKPLPN